MDEREAYPSVSRWRSLTFPAGPDRSTDRRWILPVSSPRRYRAATTDSSPSLRREADPIPSESTSQLSMTESPVARILVLFDSADEWYVICRWPNIRTPPRRSAADFFSPESPPMPLPAVPLLRGGTATIDAEPPSTIRFLNCSASSGIPDGRLGTSPAAPNRPPPLVAPATGPPGTRHRLWRSIPCETACWNPRTSWCSSASWGRYGLLLDPLWGRRNAMERTVRSSRRTWKASPSGPVERPLGLPDRPPPFAFLLYGSLVKSLSL